MFYNKEFYFCIARTNLGGMMPSSAWNTKGKMKMDVLKEKKEKEYDSR